MGCITGIYCIRIRVRLGSFKVVGVWLGFGLELDFGLGLESG